MNWKDFVKKLQSSMNALGEKLTVDGDPGPKTQAAFENYDFQITVKRKEQPAPLPVGNQPTNPAYVEAKKYDGQSESKAGFVAWLSKFWPKVGLPSYKTIIGTSFAWCGLFVAAMNFEAGQKVISGAAGARNWAKYGQEIDWKKNGIPRGAVIHINHASNCSSGSGNHVTFADGDCTAEDLKKPGAYFAGFGGNQSNAVNRAQYPVEDICEVRWPAEIEKPGPIQKSVECSGKGSTGGSTR